MTNCPLLIKAYYRLQGTVMNRLSHSGDKWGFHNGTEVSRVLSTLAMSIAFRWPRPSCFPHESKEVDIKFMEKMMSDVLCQLHPGPSSS